MFIHKKLQTTASKNKVGSDYQFANLQDQIFVDLQLLEDSNAFKYFLKYKTKLVQTDCGYSIRRHSFPGKFQTTSCLSSIRNSSIANAKLYSGDKVMQRKFIMHRCMYFEDRIVNDNSHITQISHKYIMK